MAKKKKCVGGQCADPVWKHQRAVKAGEAARLAHQKRAYERAGHLHPIEAYNVGYRTGFKRAYHYWKVRSAKLLAQERGAA